MDRRHLNFRLFITLLALICSLSITFAAKRNTINTFVKTECDSTDYPQLCYTYLSPYSSKINNDRVNLCKAALSVSLGATKKSKKMVMKFSNQGGLNLNTTEAGAMKDCVEEIGYSIDEIKQSSDEMKRYKSGYNSMFVRSNVITWVSAAITDEVTCLDGLYEGHLRLNLKKKIDKSVLRSLKLTSITLSLLNRL